MGYCIWAYVASAYHFIAADTTTAVDGPHRDLSRCVGRVGPPKSALPSPSTDAGYMRTREGSL